jgi:hypothetical protein
MILGPIEVRNPPAHRHDSQPKRERSTGRGFGDSRHAGEFVEAFRISINGPEDECVHADQEEERELGLEVGIIVVFGQFRTGEHDPPGDHEEETDPFPGTRSKEDFGNRDLGECEAEETKIGYEDQAAEDGERGQMAGQEDGVE